MPTPTPERQPSSSEVGVEKFLNNKLEAKVAPVAAEASQNGPRADDGATVAQAQVAAIANTNDDQTPGAQPVTAAAPLAADDVDVIEPEWVKKAEEAVAAHRDDPHQEEAAVEALQVDYLKARYNLDIKPDDEKP